MMRTLKEVCTFAMNFSFHTFTPTQQIQKQNISKEQLFPDIYEKKKKKETIQTIITEKERFLISF